MNESSNDELSMDLVDCVYEGVNMYVVDHISHHDPKTDEYTVYWKKCTDPTIEPGVDIRKDTPIEVGVYKRKHGQRRRNRIKRKFESTIIELERKHNTEVIKLKRELNQANRRVFNFECDLKRIKKN